MSSNDSCYPEEELNTRPPHRSVKTPRSKPNDTTGNSTQFSFTLHDEWKKILWVGFRDARNPKPQVVYRNIYPPRPGNVLPRVAAVACILSREAVDVNGEPLLAPDVSLQLCKLLLADVNSQRAARSMELLMRHTVHTVLRLNTSRVVIDNFTSGTKGTPTGGILGNAQ